MKDKNQTIKILLLIAVGILCLRFVTLWPDTYADWPEFLPVLGIVGIVYLWTRRNMGRLSAVTSIALLATMPLFVIGTGRWTTEPFMILSALIAMVSFYNALLVPEARDNIPTTKHKYDDDGNIIMQLSRRPYWMSTAGYVFFLAIAAGIFVSGPVFAILIVAPLLIWTAWMRKWKTVAHQIPWFDGAVIMTTLFALAYFYAPGLLPPLSFGIGATWWTLIYTELMILPWVIWIIYKLFDAKFRAKLPLKLNEFKSYLLTFAGMGLLFFTLFGQAMAGAMFVVILLSILLSEIEIDRRIAQGLAGLAAAMLIASVIWPVAL